ncbi:hypothetical protein TrVE_jg10799 [Triparma verrucosa]|uniref:Uncharacterized protein n=1 Tax=Triparma verrucosa TaxID=1606542 RepID=A0A9W7BS75_9STRA|nr:hypothetical protein TrVE_jg10799 [Triparma verrucosa]
MRNSSNPALSRLGSGLSEAVEEAQAKSDSEESDEDAAVIRSLQLKTTYLENEVKRLNKVVKRLKRTRTLDQNTTLKEMVDMANVCHK